MLPFSTLFLSTVLLLAVIRGSGAVHIDRATCSNLYANAVTRAFNDMLAMARVAHDRTVAARDETSSLGDRRVVINNFNTYFGVEETGSRQYRVSSIIGALQDINGGAFDDLIPGLLILCDDTYLTESTVDENGNQLPPGVYQPVNNLVSPPIWYPVGFKRCRDVGPGGAIIGAVSDSKINWMTICPGMFNTYATVAPATKDQDVSASGQYIMSIRTLGTLIFHELLHLLYPQYMATGSNEVDGFHQCIQLRQTNPASTVIMPDCIALYAFSLYMTGNDWSTGFPVVNPTQ